MAPRDPIRPADASGGESELTSSLCLLAWIWLALAARPAFADVLGNELALLLSFGLATTLAVAARRRSPVHAGSAWQSAGALMAGIGLGWLAYPVLCVFVAVAGLLLGLDQDVSIRMSASGPFELLAILLLAPVFEEVLYRERLLPALHGWVGRAPALLVSSALFALPHLEPWPVLGTFVAGNLLGALWLAWRSVSLCVGTHLGLNLAAQLLTLRMAT